MGHTVDAMLDRLLESTILLEQIVIDDNADPDEWISVLDEREELIAIIQGSGLTGERLTEVQRDKFSKINEVNQRLIPIMDNRKQGVQKQLRNVQRSKQAMHSYNDDGPNGYGAFIDRKK